MDSELIQRQLLGKYKVKEPTLQILHKQVRALIEKDFPHIHFVHVRREQNVDADRLANLAMDKGE
jgi:ribonuclease HI